MKLDIALMLTALGLFSGVESPLGDVASLHGAEPDEPADGDLRRAGFQDHAALTFMRLEQAMLEKGRGHREWIYDGLRRTLSVRPVRQAQGGQAQDLRPVRQAQDLREG